MKLLSINPHDQSLVGEVEISSEKDIVKMINKAKKAFRDWRNVDILKRIEYLKRYRHLIFSHKKEITKLTTLEMGKPLKQSLDDVDFEIGFIDYYLKKGPDNLADEIVFEKGKETYRVTYEPYGVCACIAPWNFPLAMLNSGVLPAIIAGNTVVFKPSEYTTLTQKLIIELLQNTGLPEGVVNLVLGGKETGKQLIDSPVDLVWFTGSTKVGKEIYEKCGQKFIKVLCEMGGSSPGIVFADANLNHTLDNLYWARFLNCGQVCSAIKRLFVEKPVYDMIVKLLVEKLKIIKIGNPLEKVDFGPLVSQKQLETLKGQVSDAIDKGAKIEIGGHQPKDATLSRGNYFEPTILTNIKPNMRVMTEEVFGPVLPIIPFSSEKEVVELANKTNYGLSAEIYSTDLKKGERVAKQIQAGVVAINTDNFFKPECPFGGYKESGVGREYGQIGMREFTQVKLVATVKS